LSRKTRVDGRDLRERVGRAPNLITIGKRRRLGVVSARLENLFAKSREVGVPEWVTSAKLLRFSSGKACKGSASHQQRQRLISTASPITFFGRLSVSSSGPDASDRTDGTYCTPSVKYWVAANMHMCVRNVTLALYARDARIARLCVLCVRSVRSLRGEYPGYGRAWLRAVTVSCLHFVDNVVIL